MKTLISVCVVEDIEEIRRGVRQMLDDSEAFVCLEAFENGSKAVMQLPGLQPDIVIMDIHLPDINGIECIRKLKNDCPHTQFIMFTIYENSEDVFDALAAGATGYLLKKTPREALLEALLELYNGGAPMSAHIARKVVKAFQAPATQTDHHTTLSGREEEILSLLAKGFLYKEIAERLGLTTGTVRQHIHHIYEKLHVQNRTEALNKFYGRK